MWSPPCGSARGGDLSSIPRAVSDQLRIHETYFGGFGRGRDDCLLQAIVLLIRLKMHAHAPPLLISSLLQLQVDLSTVVHMINAAEPIDAASIAAFEVNKGGRSSLIKIMPTFSSEVK